MRVMWVLRRLRRVGSRRVRSRQALIEDRPPDPAFGTLGSRGVRRGLVVGQAALLRSVPRPVGRAAHPSGGRGGLGRTSRRKTAVLVPIPELVLLTRVARFAGSDKGGAGQLSQGDNSETSK